jgi:NAD(P)H-hydrate epimerase
MTHAFVTDGGVVVPAVTSAEMAEVDRLALIGSGPNLFQMMENAGRSLADLVLEQLGSGWASSAVVVLAGVGGNGGGGVCAARHLANRGVRVEVVVTRLEGLSGVPAAQMATFLSGPGRLRNPADLSELDGDVVVDAVVGYGLEGPLAGPAARLVEWAGTQPAPVISLDVPSGIDATTGRPTGSHVTANSTLTLALPKTGLDVAAVGDLWLADLGIPSGVYRRLGLDVPGDTFGRRWRVRLRPVTDPAGLG